MTDTLSSYSSAEQAKIARIARRSLKSETTLVLTFGTVCIALFFAFSAVPPLEILARTLGLSFPFFWITASFLLAVCFALLNRIISAPRIAKAQDLDAAFKHEYQRKMSDEADMKIAKMKAEAKEK